MLNTFLPLQVYFIDNNGNKQPAGSTFGSRVVEVPDATTWLIQFFQSLSDREWDAALALMSESRIPGLGAKQITDALLGRISKLDHLTYLDLSDSEVTDDGLRSLARMPRLQHLNLSCLRITDGGLEVLRHLPLLKSFDLHHGGISDRGLANLEGCHHLERVNLRDTRSGDGAVKALTSKPLLRQFVAGATISDAGLALLHDFPIFKTWSGGQPEMSLLSAMAGPSYIGLNLSGPLTNAGIAKLAGLDGLFALNLFDTADSGAVTPAALDVLAQIPNLGWLGCAEELCNNETMAHIAALPHLRFLMCQDTIASDTGFTALSRSKSIEYIWGRRCYNLTGHGFAALASMPALRGLAVTCKNVDDEGLSGLPRFPSLREFMPMDITDAGFRHIGLCGQLEVLHCMYCRETSDTATEYIASLDKLKIYQAWSTQVTDRSLDIIGQLTAMEQLLFYQCGGITDTGLNALARLPRLRQINLESLRNVTAKGTAVFPAHVQVNHSPQ